MDKTDVPKNMSPGYAKFDVIAKKFKNAFGSHLREPDGSSVTTVRGMLDGVASVLTYHSKSDETTLTAAE